MKKIKNLEKAVLLLLLLCSVTMMDAQTQEVPLKVRFFCTNWGMTDTWDAFCERVKTAGFDGVETWLPADGPQLEEMEAALEKHGLQLILLSAGSGKTFDAYLANFVDNLERAVARHPVLVNCHTGKDHFTFAQNKALIDAATAISEDSGVEVVHETHRGRFSFAAHITKTYLEALPDLSLALDISHWCNVHESMLADQPEAVELALRRTRHIHARIGHTQGPQVNDPRAPEWEGVVEQHVQWWDSVVEHQRQQGNATLTITTEFGPPTYMPVLPYTRQPVADQWVINQYMLKQLKARYTQ
ncbi:sugar phosphate isomerase/epimerase family protein [Parapedobacter pyrenivorans]|uniref:sugar phosphate isomerase/epimerase family protein n=1 Tax=Parapedobacter pyrenivorans TaxID=1305674 RepID=UPI00333FF72D